MSFKLQAGKHVFGRARPSQAGKHPIVVEPKRDTHFRELPPPVGQEPFQLDLADIMPAGDYQRIKQKKALTFHVNGDMGGIKFAVPQELVAKGMEADFDTKLDASENPAFLYILGDCVYFNGEVEQYYSQFYQPYQFYPRPIVAVPGNHDGENLPTGHPLDGFLRNFCAAHPGIKNPESGDSHRTAMIQPNVYWTLLTPCVNIIGLYSNVPEGGEIKPPQTDWLVSQLKMLPKNKPLFVALHHPIYSADDHHSGSLHMKLVLEDATKQAKRHPDMVIAGHVHNYQRLTKKTKDGDYPYLVVGAGGYHNLHHIMKVNGEHMIPPVVFQDKEGDGVRLDTYSDDHHGFLRLKVDERTITGHYYVVPRPQEPWSKGSQLIDRFEFDWKAHKYIPNTL